MSIFPIMDTATQQLADAKKELPLFQEYAYDFVNNRLLERNGKTYLIAGNDALKVWIYKTLHTIRYYHVAYSTAYGNEVKSLMGQPIQEDILLPELQRFIVESLMVNPYIRELKNFSFVVDGAAVQVIFECVTVYGDMPLEYFYTKGG